VLGMPVVDIGVALLYLAAILTLWSMVLYLSAAWPVLSAGKRLKPEGNSTEY